MTRRAKAKRIELWLPIHADAESPNICLFVLQNEACPLATRPDRRLFREVLPRKRARKEKTK